MYFFGPVISDLFIISNASMHQIQIIHLTVVFLTFRDVFLKCYGK